MYMKVFRHRMRSKKKERTTLFAFAMSPTSWLKFGSVESSVVHKVEAAIWSNEDKVRFEDFFCKVVENLLFCFKELEAYSTEFM